MDGKMEAVENIAHRDTSGIISPPVVWEEICAEFLDEDHCREWVLKRLHPLGPVCPRCHVRITDPESSQAFWDSRRFRCPACRRHITALSGTVLAGSHRDFRETILLALLIYLQVNPRSIAAKLDESEATVRMWAKKFRNLTPEEGRDQ
jgi:transposase-like protein